MWRSAVAVVLGVALAGVALAHAVLAQSAPAGGVQLTDQTSLI